MQYWHNWYRSKAVLSDFIVSQPSNQYVCLQLIQEIVRRSTWGECFGCPDDGSNGDGRYLVALRPQWGHGSPLCYLPVCQCQYLDCINRPTDLHANYVPTSPFCTLRICSASGHLFLACHKWGTSFSTLKDQNSNIQVSFKYSLTIPGSFDKPKYQKKAFWGTFCSGSTKHVHVLMKCIYYFVYEFVWHFDAIVMIV